MHCFHSDGGDIRVWMFHLFVRIHIIPIRIDTCDKRHIIPKGSHNVCSNIRIIDSNPLHVRHDKVSTICI